MQRRGDGGSSTIGAIAARWARGAAPFAVVAGLALAMLAGLAVLPARTWLSQRDDLNETRDELEQIEADVADLEAELAELQTDSAVERMARENFDLVYPGDESYRILPADE
ncbi:MAG: septum formation initiator family protein [Actinomycetota bacterium]